MFFTATLQNIIREYITGKKGDYLFVFQYYTALHKIKTLQGITPYYKKFYIITVTE